jgi:acetylornithine/succinyldiaminopimelate/putrescine aminotransferase
MKQCRRLAYFEQHGQGLLCILKFSQTGLSLILAKRLMAALAPTETVLLNSKRNTLFHFQKPLVVSTAKFISDCMQFKTHLVTIKTDGEVCEIEYCACNE